jgi:hypothetical protein
MSRPGVAIVDERRLMAEPAEQHAREQSVDLVIFGDEDR